MNPALHNVVLRPAYASDMIMLETNCEIQVGREKGEHSSIPAKAYEIVIEDIKDQITKGLLKEGHRLPPERQLAQKLGVSRNSVREAIRSLGIIGVITSTQGAGNYVSEQFGKSLIEWMSMMYMLRGTDYQQFSELRKGLELQAASLALTRISKERANELVEIARALEQCKDEKTSAELDKNLHQGIIHASENKLLDELFQATSHMMDLFILDMRKKILGDLHTRDVLQATHNDIATALYNRNEVLLRSAYDRHFLLIDKAIQALHTNEEP